jgi:hypothetical protein
MSEPTIPILVIRDQRVILDSDLARLYGVRTGALNQAVKRNGKRFPEDFVFRLSSEEVDALRYQSGAAKPGEGKPSQSVTPHSQPDRSQIVTLDPQDSAGAHGKALRSQFVTLKSGRGQHRKYLPFAFTEFGALMAANVLNSSEAVKMSLYVIRAFVKIREELSANSAILKRLAQIDDTLFLHDKVLRDLYQRLRPLLAPPPDPPPKPRIGFQHK